MRLFSVCLKSLSLFYLLSFSCIAFADLFEKDDRLIIQTNLYNIHYYKNPEYLNYSLLLGVEWERANLFLFGALFFKNSYNQPVGSLYIAYRHPLFNSNFYAKVLAGPMYGYVGKYQHKVPFNYKGLSPLVIPSLGYQTLDFWHRSTQIRVELQVVALSGLLLTAGFAFK